MEDLQKCLGVGEDDGVAGRNCHALACGFAKLAASAGIERGTTAAAKDSVKTSLLLLMTKTSEEVGDDEDQKAEKVAELLLAYLAD